MALIINIDTAVESTSVCVAKDGRPLQFAMNGRQKEQAPWLHPAIEKIMKDGELPFATLEAVAVTMGPGSYTGLRVGMSVAKGLCYALNIPLILINTLELMATVIKDQPADYFCPMIDARRMEVFTAVYNKQLDEIIKPCAMIIDGKSFEDQLNKGKMIFCGNGSYKLKERLFHTNALFSNTSATAADMTSLSESRFLHGKFADLAYAEPLYLKEFYQPQR